MASSLLAANLTMNQRVNLIELLKHGNELKKLVISGTTKVNRIKRQELRMVSVSLLSLASI
jgi:hypothetical protein